MSTMVDGKSSDVVVPGGGGGGVAGGGGSGGGGAPPGPWRPRGDGNGMLSKLVPNFLDPKETAGMDNGIPLSPQWLVSKSEKPPGEPLTPKPGNHDGAPPTPRDNIWRRNDDRRWKEEERETIRRDRWKEMDRERPDRYNGSSSAVEVPKRERWTNFTRDPPYETRRDKWNTRWGPDDKDRDFPREKEAGDRDRVNHEPGPWRPSHGRGRGEAPPPLGSTPPKHAPGFGRGRGDSFSSGRGRGNYEGTGILHSPGNFSGGTNDNPDGNYRYPRSRLLDIYKKSSSDRLPDGFIEVDELTLEHPVEPLAVSDPVDEEEIVLESIQKGDIISSGASGQKDTNRAREDPVRTRPRVARPPDDTETTGHESFPKPAIPSVREAEERLVSHEKASEPKQQLKADENQPRYSYIDPNNNVQSLFTASEMTKWLEQGFFGLDLLVRDETVRTSREFYPLGSVMPHLRPKAQIPPGFNVKQAEESFRQPTEVSHSPVQTGLEEAYLSMRMSQVPDVLRQGNYPPGDIPWPEVSHAQAARQHELQQQLRLGSLQPELAPTPRSPYPPQRSNSALFLDQLQRPQGLQPSTADQYLRQQQLLQQQQRQQLLQQQQQPQQQMHQSLEELMGGQQYPTLGRQYSMPQQPSFIDNRWPDERSVALQRLQEQERVAALQRMQAGQNPLEQERLAALQRMEQELLNERSARMEQERSVLQRLQAAQNLTRQGDSVVQSQVGFDMSQTFHHSAQQLQEDLLFQQQNVPHAGHFDRSLSLGRITSENLGRMPSENLGRMSSENLGRMSSENLGRMTSEHDIPSQHGFPSEYLDQKPLPIKSDAWPMDPKDVDVKPIEKLDKLFQRFDGYPQDRIDTDERSRRDMVESLAPLDLPVRSEAAYAGVEHTSKPMFEVQPEVSKQETTWFAPTEQQKTSKSKDVQQGEDMQTILTKMAAPVKNPPTPVRKDPIPETPAPTPVATRKDPEPTPPVIEDDGGEFIDPKEVKKNKRRASKNKANKAAVAVPPPTESSTVLASTKSATAKQVQEVLPSPPRGHSLADYMVSREEPAQLQPIPAWSMNSGKQPRPARSLKEIQEAEQAAREEQEMKARILYEQQQQQLLQQQAAAAAAKPSILRTIPGGPAWQTSSTPAVPPATSNTKAAAASKPKAKYEDEYVFWDYEAKPKADRNQPKANTGPRQAASTVSTSSDFPSLSSARSTAPTSNVKKPAAPKKDAIPVVSPAALAEGRAFQQWCEAQVKKINNRGQEIDMALLEYCVWMPSEEAGQSLMQYLSHKPEFEPFKEEFLKRKGALPSDVLRSVFNISDAVVREDGKIGKVGEAEFEECKSKKKGRKNKKTMPSLLNFNVTSNRINMGEIQHPED